MDIVDIILLGLDGRGDRRGSLDDLARRLAGGHPVREPSLAEFIADFMQPPSLSERIRQVDSSIDLLIKTGVFKAVQPVTPRTRIQISADVVYLGPEGFKDTHPHQNILIRHPRKRDRWRLYSICPRHPNQDAMHIKGVEDIEEAERIANIILDFGLHLISYETMEEALMKAHKTRAAAPDPSGPKPETPPVEPPPAQPEPAPPAEKPAQSAG